MCSEPRLGWEDTDVSGAVRSKVAGVVSTVALVSTPVSLLDSLTSRAMTRNRRVVPACMSALSVAARLCC